jgi:hypothetical protein
METVYLSESIFAVRKRCYRKPHPYAIGKIANEIKAGWLHNSNPQFPAVRWL